MFDRMRIDQKNMISKCDWEGNWKKLGGKVEKERINGVRPIVNDHTHESDWGEREKDQSGARG